MKLPAFQFYPGDWLKDPKLRMCSAATRGIWLDWICAMHEDNRSGQLSGTVAQLARLATCTTDEAESALWELHGSLTANVTGLPEMSLNSHAIVTVINRRMRRERLERESARERKTRQRFSGGNDSATTAGAQPVNNSESRPGHASVPDLSRSYSSPSSSSSDNTYTEKPPEDPDQVSMDLEGSDDATAFAETFRSMLPGDVKLPRNWLNIWADCYRDLVRLDQRDPKDILAVCEWARNDPFWGTNFYSPAKLRKRNTQGVLYYDVFAQKMRAVPSTAVRAKPDYSQGWATR